MVSHDEEKRLAQAMDDGDEIIRAPEHIARVRGISELARKTGLDRKSLY
jgi:DNA-binding phage protein